ncbi:MAG: hypothetical protein GXW99_08720 [Clostridiales bacterium]|nr:hypothetical protein [Clostridiales bacterium]
MANETARKKRHGTSAVYGNLAYDLDALARERQFEDAGKIREEERQVQPVRRSRPAAQPALRLSPMLVMGVVMLAAMVIVLLMGCVKLTKISSSVVEMKSQLGDLQEAHVALLTKYETTFDLTTVKEAAEAAGMKKPSSGQISYIDLSGPDTAVVYEAGGESAAGKLFSSIGRGLSSVVEYFK